MKRSMGIATLVAVGIFALLGAAASYPHDHQKGAAADKKFMMETAKGGIAEVELSKLAKDRASSEAVKRFAERVVEDHSKANDELKDLASRKGVTLPSDTDAKHKMMMEQLSRFSGAAFDRAYMQDMVNDHRAALAAFRREESQSKDPDTKAWVSKTLPTIEEHYKMAHEISGTFGNMHRTHRK